MAFVLTPHNQAALTDYVLLHRPELVLIDIAAAQSFQLTTEQWLAHAPPLSEIPPPPPQLPSATPVVPGRWTFSPERRQLFRPDGRDCRLTVSEFNAFRMLLQRRPEPVSRMDVSKQVLGRPHRNGDRAVDIMMHKLRSKLGDGAIVTIRGAGYAFAGFADSEAGRPV